MIQRRACEKASAGFLAVMLCAWSALLLQPVRAQTLKPPDSRGDVARGATLAKQACASCHSIDATGASAMPKAPPLRDLSKRYNLDDLQESLAEGLSSVHDTVTVPDKTFEPDDVDSLIAYIRSITAK